jgi:DNA invertase Pin-like site-specific DNA recombinase
MPEKTAVIYCRVSTIRQAEEELSIQSQRQRCEDKARALDATVLRVYSDEGLSGQSGDRPAFQQAILYCETHNPTYFITWSTSRFARNRLDAQLYKRRLSQSGVTLVYAGMEIDRDTPDADVYGAEERSVKRFAAKAEDFRHQVLRPLVQEAGKANYAVTGGDLIGALLDGF